MTTLLPKDIDTFGKRLKKRIKERGYTQDEFSEKLGVSKSTLVKYMSDKSNRIDPPLSVFVEMCDILETRYNYMLDGSIPLLDDADGTVYMLMKKLGYDMQFNPDNDDEIAIKYHGEVIYLQYEEIKEKFATIMDFLLYQKTK